MRIDADLHRMEERLDGKTAVAPLQVELSSSLAAGEDLMDEGEFMFL
jgi:hypothetical protein